MKISNIMINILNRKAKFDYHILEEYSAGICLTGPEVKAIRDYAVSISGSFCFLNEDEIWIKGMSVTIKNIDDSSISIRERKLLLKKREIQKIKKSMDKGITLVPLKLYTSDRNIIKIEIGLAKGKKKYDKREDIKKRDIEREIRLKQK